jgi:hypothetical protein
MIPEILGDGKKSERKIQSRLSFRSQLGHKLCSHVRSTGVFKTLH